MYKTPGEEHNVRVAKNGIDDFLASLDSQPGAVVEGNAAELARTAKTARPSWPDAEHYCAAWTAAPIGGYAGSSANATALQEEWCD